MKISRMIKIAACACMVAASAFILTGCSNEVEETAKDITTKLEQDNGGLRTCKKVKLGDKIGDNKWAANATMSDDSVIPIIVEQKGDMIYVTAPVAE